MEILIGRDRSGNHSLGRHTLYVRLDLEPFESAELRTLYCSPDYTVANCMSMGGRGVVLWVRSYPDRPEFDEKRPWILKIGELRRGIVFSAHSRELLDELSQYFEKDWPREFRREWEARKRFWADRLRPFAPQRERDFSGTRREK